MVCVRARLARRATTKKMCITTSPQPPGDGVGVVLVHGTVFRRIPSPQHGWEDLDDHRFASAHLPAVKRPEVDLLPDRLPNPVQPGNSGVRGFRHLSLNVELEIALGRGCPSFGDTEFVTGAGAGVARSQRFDRGVVPVGRPVFNEIGQEVIPVGQPVALEVGQRQGKREIESGDEQLVRIGLLDQSFSHFLAAPVAISACRGGWRVQSPGQPVVCHDVDLQTRRPGDRRPAARIVDADEFLEHGGLFPLLAVILPTLCKAV